MLYFETENNLKWIIKNSTDNEAIGLIHVINKEAVYQPLSFNYLLSLEEVSQVHEFISGINNSIKVKDKLSESNIQFQYTITNENCSGCTVHVLG